MNIYLDDERIIGYVNDIKNMVHNELKRGSIDDYELIDELLTELSNYNDNDYVNCLYTQKWILKIEKNKKEITNVYYCY